MVVKSAFYTTIAAHRGQAPSDREPAGRLVFHNRDRRLRRSAKLELRPELEAGLSVSLDAMLRVARRWWSSGCISPTRLRCAPD